MGLAHFFLLLSISLLMAFGQKSIAADSFEGSFRELCQVGGPQHFTDSQIRYFQESGLFPRGNDSIASRRLVCQMRTSPIQDLMELKHYQEKSILTEGPQSALNIAQDLVDRIKVKADREFQSGQDFYTLVSKCAPLLDQGTQLPADCQSLQNETIPMLNERLKLMRKFLGWSLIQQKKYSQGLKHSFFVDPENSPAVQELSTQELREIRDEQKSSDATVHPQEIYLRLLSQSPVLLFFKTDQITAKELAVAMKEQQNSKMKISDRDYLQLDQILLNVLSEVPANQRQDYCVIAKALRANNDLEANFKRYILGIAALPFGFKTLLGFVTSTAASWSLDSAIDAQAAAQKLSFQLNMCLQTAYKPNGKENPICDFKSIQEQSAIVKSSLLYLPAAGSPKSLKRLEEDSK